MNTQDGIADSNVFICSLNPTFSGSSGEDNMRFAMSLGKPIFVWRTPGNGHLPVPSVLDGYDDVHVVDGSYEDMCSRVREYLEILPGSLVEFATHRY